METCNSSDEVGQDCRKRRGTWLWFVVNILLFPGPAYFTLMRVREFSMARSMLHLLITFFLLFLIIAAAACTVFIPVIGNYWLLLPLLSGPLLLFLNRSLRTEFQPFDLVTVGRKHFFTLLALLAVLLVYNILPELDLIALNEAGGNRTSSNFEQIPLWQDCLILLFGAVLLVGGYIMNATPSFSINRSIILYSCYMLISVLLYVLLELAFGLLRVTGGFGSLFALVLLASVLAVDYYDAATFGQYARRFFLLTCTKGIFFVLLWLCFLGLPQKVASLYAARGYNRVEPIASYIPYESFIFSDRQRFSSGHEAHRRLRVLYARALQGNEQGRLAELNGLISSQRDISLLKDTDVSYLQRTLATKKKDDTARLVVDLPFFRPIQADWDVMLTAVILQKNVSVADLDQTISGFKSSLPKGSEGQLPDLKAPFHSHYVANATGMMVDFIPPAIENVQSLLSKGLIPVLSIRLAGKQCWAALVHIDEASGLAWLRLESVEKQQKAIQKKFDANEAEGRRREILASQYVPMALDYLTRQLDNMSAPVMVFSENGLKTLLPEMFSAEFLAAIHTEIAKREATHNTTDSPDDVDIFTGYHGYIKAIGRLRHLLTPLEFEAEPFLQDSPYSVPTEQGKERLARVSSIVKQLGEMRDEDRMTIAYLLSSQNHVAADPALFLRLASPLPVTSDLADCRRAFVIGRSLYLLGHHQKALEYFSIAFHRHPFTSEYEMWYRIALLKLGRPLPPSYSSPDRQPDLQLYFQTISDVKNNRKDIARKRLEKALKKDSHNVLVNQLMSKYFNQPLDDRFFFQAGEGL